MIMIRNFIDACTHGDITTVAALLPSVDPTKDNNMAIRCASYNGHADIVRLLLEDPRVDPSSNDNLIIRYVSSKGHVDVVRLLLADPRVDPSAGDNQGKLSSFFSFDSSDLSKHLERLLGVNT